MIPFPEPSAVSTSRIAIIAFACAFFSLPAHALTLCPDASGGISACGAGGPAAAPGDLIVDGVAYRSYDGSGNNIANADWGAAGTNFDSRASSDGMTRTDGPSARDVSNQMGSNGSAGTPTNGQGLSSMFWAWGQFVDHDITLTLEGEDPLSLGGDMSDVKRSTQYNGNQFNAQTAYIDASMVYGPDADTVASLRANDGTGRMLLDENGYLPTDEDGNFRAGDPRANEQQQLISMQTVFAREHNRIADSLSAANPDWSGEKVFQESRALVGAQIQAVTYNEWLPKLLGEGAIGDYTGYDSSVNAGLTNEFSTCAFRFCHSMIPDELERLAENGDPIAQGHMQLRDGFFNPDEFREAGGTDPLLRGLASQEAMAVDRMFSEELRNFLDAGDGNDSDLMARNIARGRDHGIEDYNLLRAAYGLDPVESWEELTDDPLMIAELTSLYGPTLEGLDPFLGAMMESAVDGSLLGELNWTIIADQFTRLRDGDRYWFEAMFEGDILAWLNTRTLSDIIRDNTDIAWLQDDVFLAVARGAVSEPGLITLLLILGLYGRARRGVPA